MAPLRPGPNPGPSSGPIPPLFPEPIPPLDPVPFDGGPSFASGSPHTAIVLFGVCTSGGPIRVGSISSLGLALLTTTAGGTNCRAANFGARPLLAGARD